MGKGGFHQLTIAELNSMIERARKLGDKIIQEIRKRYTLN